ncbi:MAG: alpha/beta hydrolase domain-containing protein [Gammaproteobacteria bacterium]|nr:alpha/beta hydrolase domain-containing protein [Gammaproteobacteria bacterium]
MKATYYLFASFFFAASLAAANIVNIDIDRSKDIANGTKYGLAGPYEALSGKIHYAIDPKNSANNIIIDIDKSATNSDGMVEFSADFYLIKPKDMKSGNGAVLFEVANRGRPGALNRFNRAISSLQPTTADEMGDGFLLREGFTLLWVGWQHDTPLIDNQLRTYPPIATDNGKTIEGIVRSDIIVSEKTYSHSLGNRNHIAYPVSDPLDPRNKMTVRDGITGPRQNISRDNWQFARQIGEKLILDPTMVYLETGFEPGKIYDVIYVSEDPPLAGLGLSAIRETISQLKYGSTSELGISSGDINRAITFGSSQSGRLLRTFLFDGFNEDTKNRKVFDGIIAHVAGAARGSFNQRFAQASRAPGGAFEYPNRVFPFADITQIDPATGNSDGLLTSIPSNAMPKIFYTNSSTEYWRSVGALTHISLDGGEDLSLMDNVRTYDFAGTQHYPATFPSMSGHENLQPNPNDYRWFLRGLLVAMDRWITNDNQPPPSRYSTLEQDTLVEMTDFQFPEIPGLNVLTEVSTAYALDFGPELGSSGIISQEPPNTSHPYPFMVPQVDASGNEIDGLRSPDIAVPLATYTGWRPTSPVSGTGLYIPFSRTRSEREAQGDPRLSIEERYSSRAEYLGLVAESTMTLIRDRYLLNQDLSVIIDLAGKHWDHRMNTED